MSESVWPLTRLKDAIHVYDTGKTYSPRNVHCGHPIQSAATEAIDHAVHDRHDRGRPVTCLAVAAAAGRVHGAEREAVGDLRSLLRVRILLIRPSDPDAGQRTSAHRLAFRRVKH